MKKDCWKILRINRTRDTAVIKKAYLGLIKKYHPDKYQAPEEIRRYTIKGAEVIQAYQTALDLANSPVELVTVDGESRPSDKYVPFLDGIVSLFAIIFYLQLFNIYSVYGKVFHLLSYYPLVNQQHSIKSIAISFVITVAYSFIVSICISGLSVLPIAFLCNFIEKSKFYKYSYKVSYLLMTITNIIIVYYYSPEYIWPFKHLASNYYVLLNSFYHTLAWSFSPFLLLLFWVMDNYRYHKVKYILIPSETTLFDN